MRYQIHNIHQKGTVCDTKHTKYIKRVQYMIQNTTYIKGVQ